MRKKKIFKNLLIIGLSIVWFSLCIVPFLGSLLMVSISTWLVLDLIFKLADRVFEDGEEKGE